ncbi:MAG: RHS repeat protein [Bacteroidetes bacterium]|nr:RHS repeat protein [Bacteroidota bacterium]
MDSMKGVNYFRLHTINIDSASNKTDPASESVFIYHRDPGGKFLTLKMIPHKGNGVVKIDSLFSDQSGMKETKLEISGKEISSRSIWNYDAQHHPVDEWLRDSTIHIQFETDAAGRKIKAICKGSWEKYYTYNNAGAVTGKREYAYVDKDGNATKTLNLTSSDSFVYDAEGKKTREYYWDIDLADPRSCDSTIWNYKNGNVSSVYYYYPGNKSEILSLTYDDAGRMTDATWANKFNSDPIRELKYSYDKNGNVLTRNSYGNMSLTEIWETTYDAKGRPAKCIYHDGIGGLTKWEWTY